MRFEVARWKPNIEESMTHLWEAPEVPADRLIVALTRVMAIIDDTARLTSRGDDQDLNVPSIFHVKALLASLQQVKKGLTEDILENRKCTK